MWGDPVREGHMAIVDQLIAPLASVAIKAIQEFHASPEEKMQAQQAINDAADKAKAQAADYDVQLNSIAGQNIRSEADSGDKFTVRARPAVIWMGSALIAWNYGLVPYVGAHWHLSPAVLPDAFWWTWGTVVTGYVFNRTAEKIAQMPGDSQINLGGLIKIGNKS